MKKNPFSSNRSPAVVLHKTEGVLSFLPVSSSSENIHYRRLQKGITGHQCSALLWAGASVLLRVVSITTELTEPSMK